MSIHKHATTYRRQSLHKRHCRPGRTERRTLHLELLEDRRLLSLSSAVDQDGGHAPLDYQELVSAATVPTRATSSASATDGQSPVNEQYVPGEILIGFDSEIANLYLNRGQAQALEAAGKLVGGHGLASARVLYNLPASADRGALLATHWQLPANADVEALAAQLAKLPGVAYAEPNGLVTIDSHDDDLNPGDPSFLNPPGWSETLGYQEHLFLPPGQTSAHINAEAVWDITTGGDTTLGSPSAGQNAAGDVWSNSEVIVAVIDTGVDINHPDLDDNIVRDGDGAPVGFSALDNNTSSATSRGVSGKAKGGIPGPPTGGGGGGPTFADDSGHGTHVAGIIAAEVNNLADLAAEAGGDASWTGGVVGVAPRATILPVKVLDNGGGGTHEDVAEGIVWAAQNGAQIINMSLGGGFSQTVQAAVQFAYDAGVLIVSSAGNGNAEASGYPAAYKESLSVAAVNKFDTRAGFSNYGYTVDIAAPGVSILSTFIDLIGDEIGELTGAYGRISGTSMASPVVAGVAALMKSLNPLWTPVQIAAQLLATTALANHALMSSDLDIDSLNPGFEGKLGAGRVDALAAVDTVVSAPVITAVGGLGADGGILNRFELGSVINVQISHVMNAADVLDATSYELFDTSSGTPVDFSLLTTSYDAFPGRGVQLQVDENLPDGTYEFRVLGDNIVGDGVALDADLDGVAGGTYIHQFTLEATPITTSVVPPFGAMIHQGSVSDQIDASVPPLAAGIDFAAEMTFGPDGNLYISSLASSQVFRYDTSTGELDVFVSAGSGGLEGPRGLAFGPDGNLYVAGSYSDGVYVYDATGEPVDLNDNPADGIGNQLDADGSGGLAFPTGLTIVADGTLFVSSNGTNEILTYNSASDNFTSFASGEELNGPQGLAHAGNSLYVASYYNHSILQYNDSNGSLAGTLVATRSGGLQYPLGLAFSDTIDDGGMELHVTSNRTNEVLRYDGSTGEFVDIYVQEGDGGLAGPVDVAFDNSATYVSSGQNHRVIRYEDVDDDGQIDRGAGGDIDVDNFRIALDGDPDQLVTVRVRSSAELAVELDHDGIDVTPPVDYDPGPGVLYQAVGPLAAGTLSIVVSGPDALTSRAYDVEITLNALLEQESNDVTEQGLDPSVIELQPLLSTDTIYRGAVLGSVEQVVPQIFAETEGAPNDLRGSWQATGTATTGATIAVGPSETLYSINPSSNPTSPLNKGITGTVGGGNDGSDTFNFSAHTGDVIYIRTWGTNSGGGSLRQAWVDLHGPSGAQLANGTVVSGAKSDFEVVGYTIPETGDYHMHVWTDRGRGSYTMTADLVSEQNPRADTIDFYSLTVPAGATHLGAVSSNPDVLLRILEVDNGGTPVTSTQIGGLGVIEPVQVDAGEYTIEVTSAAGFADYGLAWTIDGAFDITAWNNSSGEAQDISDLAGVVGYVGGSTVGYYTDYLTGTTDPEAAIVKAGSIPVHITDIAAFDFDTIDVLLVNEWNNLNISDGLSGRLGDIQAFVESGGVFVVNDRFVNDSETGPADPHPLLVGRNDGGADDILLIRNFDYGADIDVIPTPPGATILTDGSGPGGAIDNTTLDGGNYSNHGYALASTLQSSGDVQLLSAGPFVGDPDSDRIAAFSYELGGGNVYYSTIPVDFYLGSSNNFSRIYMPNMVAYANSLIASDEDWYELAGASGKTYELQVPGAGSGEFKNNLSPLLELYSADDLVTPIQSSAVSITVPDNGQYYIKVSSVASFGEYVLIDPPTADSTAPSIPIGFEPLAISWQDQWESIGRRGGTPAAPRADAGHGPLSTQLQRSARPAILPTLVDAALAVDAPLATTLLGDDEVDLAFTRRALADEVWIEFPTVDSWRNGEEISFDTFDELART